MSDRRQILKNLVFNIGVFFINLLISFLLAPYLIRTVGKEAYGYTALINNIVGYASIITTAIGSMAGRFITDSYYKGRKEESEQYFNSVIFAYWAVSLLFSLLGLLGVVFIDRLLTIPPHLVHDVRWIFGIASVVFIVNLNTGLFGVGTYVKNRVDLASSINLARSLVNVTCILVLLWAFPPSIVFISAAALVAELCSGSLNIRLKPRLLPDIKLSPVKKHDWSKVKTLVSSGIWNSVNQLSNILLTQLDLLIANLFIGAAAMGDYSVVKIIPVFIFTLLGMLSGTFYPHFNILYAKGQKEELISDIRKSIKLVCCIVSIPIGFLIVFGEPFFSLWVPTMDAPYLFKLSLLTLVPMIIGTSINPVFGVFTITNKLKVPALVLLGFGIANTALVFLLLKITNWGLWCIPIVGGTLHALRNLVFSPIYGARCLGQKWSTFYPDVAKGCLTLISVIVVGLLVKSTLPCSSWSFLLLCGVLVAGISLLVNIKILLSRSEQKSIIETVKGFAGRIIQ